MLRIYAFYVFFATFAISCNSNSQTVKLGDIVGKWKDDSSLAKVDFFSNGTCVVTDIPADYFFFPPEDFKNKIFSGKGNWSLKKGNHFGEILINLNSVSDIDKNGVSFSLHVAGRNGLFDNKPPWYIFMWEDDEGGNRIKFDRVK